MNANHATVPDRGISLRTAARIAGYGLLAMVAVGPFAELYVYPKLVVTGNMEVTAQNIMAGKGLFLSGVLAYFIMLSLDVLVAWAFYNLLIPVNRSLSLLVGWMRLVYAVIALVALSDLVMVYRVLSTPEYQTLFGSDQLHAQVRLLLGSFQYTWGMGLGLFGVHLGLLGYLVYRSGYVPRVFGALLVVNGLGWVVDSAGPYLFPGADLSFLMVAFFGEVIFALWLAIRGGKIAEPAAGGA